MKSFFRISVMVILFFAFCQATRVLAQNARYKIKYEFDESARRNLGHVEVKLNFLDSPEQCRFFGDIILGFTNYEGTFPASASTNQLTAIWQAGGPGNETFYYTNDIRDIYKTTSYWTKTYPLRESQYPTWRSLPDDYFKVTIWPDNLEIQSITGPENGTVLAQYDTTTINATSGFASDAYTWKYQFGGLDTTWFDFPISFQNKSTISFTGDDLFNSSFINKVKNGTKIIIMVWAKNRLGVSKKYGVPKELVLKYSGPKIKSVTPQKAKCNESTTTNVIVKLDQRIKSGRMLKAVYYIGNGNSNPPFYIHANAINNELEYLLEEVPVNRSMRLQLVELYENNADSTSRKDSFYVSTKEIPFHTNGLLPEKLMSAVTVSGIYCHGGQDAQLQAQAKGGTSPYTLTYINPSNTAVATHQFANANTTQWLNDPVTVGNAGLGLYKLQARDFNGCEAALASVTVNQPATALSGISRSIKEVSGYGLVNGEFEITLKGGTSSGISGYTPPQLRSEYGTLYTAVYKSSAADAYTFLFDQLPAGNYSFRAEDRNFTNYKSAIRDSSGCLSKETFTVIQPPPLLLTLEQTADIRCNKDQTAVLVAHARGGKRFVTGKPYLYSWFYSKDGVAAYAPLVNTDSVFLQRPAGFYRLTVRDQNNNSSTAQLQVTEPAAVEFDIAVKNVTCLNWTDGALTLSNIRGGTAPYAVMWPDGSTGMEIKDLAHGFYQVEVTDDLGCIVTRNTKVKDTLNEITLERGSLRLPHCYGEANGSLAVKVTLLSPPYTVAWNTGSTDTLLTNIPSGVYTVQVLNSKNCLKEATFTLPDPARIPLELEADRYLCLGQVADYDLTVKDSLYTYRWQGHGINQQTPTLRLENEGLYTASIADNRGCYREEQVQVHRVNRVIASDFVVSTQVFAGDEVSLVNITQNGMADTCVWQFYDHPDIEVLDNSFEYATVIFKKAGNYKVGLKSQQEECLQVSDKQVKVLEPTFDHKPYTGATSFIRDFEIRPNPSDGNFEVMIRLEDIASVKLRLLDFYSNADLIEIQEYDAKEYLIPVHLSVAPGTYVLFLETPYGTRIHKIVIM